MQLPPQYLLLLLGLLPCTLAVSEPPEKPVDPECTVTSPFSENFFDLRKLRRDINMPPPKADWQVKGLDYNTTFSINICGTVLTDIAPEGANNDEVGAFYEKDGKVYSIGSASISPYFRGRKLVLSYEGGSPCPDAPNYRKSTLMSLMCDHEQFRKPSVSFVGQMNDCAYFFEVRTAFACATINQAQALGPGAVFGAIMGVFAMVYLVGGIVYQRTVMHARGWRQIPHYHAWAAALGFFWDMARTCWNLVLERAPLPSSLRPSSAAHEFGARTVGGNPLIRGRVAGYADENQLIDQLDDDWGESDN